MNGLELHERIMALTHELEKYPKLALAHVVATQTLVRAYVGESPKESTDAAAAALHDELGKARPIARSVYLTRRLRRLREQIENPKPKRKRRKKKRHA